MESERNERHMLVLFGSQTGTAEDTAERIRRDGIRRRMDVLVSALDEYQLANLTLERIVIFCVSTTGQGDPPDNMRKFWNFIWRKNLPPGCLSGLQYAVLGFGDSSYLKFNFVAKKLDKRLQMLGANQLISLGLADDQHDYGSSAVVDPWISNLWDQVLSIYPLSSDLEVISDSTLLPSRYAVTFLDQHSSQNGSFSSSESLKDGSMPLVNGTLNTSSSTEIPSEKKPFYAKVSDNKSVTAEGHWQDVRLITFDITNSNIKYMPGDVLAVKPRNSSESAAEFIELLQLDPHQKFIVSSAGSDNGHIAQLPKPCTVQYLVENYLDICALPRRYFWELMATFTDSEIERDKLWEFCSASGQEELHNYCTRPRRNIVEVLRDFPHASSHIPFQYLFEMIGYLRPRQFSIASSQLVDENKVQLLIAVVRYKTKLKKPRLGVCSNYLASLVPSYEDTHRVAVWVQKGTMYFPGVEQNVDIMKKVDPDLSDPHLIMVGPGTGCAPFRSCILQRAACGIRGHVLFFGCRNRDKDFFFKEEWEGLQNERYMTLHVAFSRDQATKDYVQHSIARQSTLIWELMDKQRAFFYIAGNAKNMPDQVRDALKTIIVSEGKMTDDEAEAYILRMIKEKRYQCETWS